MRDRLRIVPALAGPKLAKTHDLYPSAICLAGPARTGIVPINFWFASIPQKTRFKRFEPVMYDDAVHVYETASQPAFHSTHQPLCSKTPAARRLWYNALGCNNGATVATRYVVMWNVWPPEMAWPRAFYFVGLYKQVSFVCLS